MLWAIISGSLRLVKDVDDSHADGLSAFPIRREQPRCESANCIQPVVSSIPHTSRHRLRTWTGCSPSSSRK